MIWWTRSASSTDPYSPPAADILARFCELWLSSGFTTNAVPSLRNLFIGLAIAIVLGVGVGAVIAQVTWLYAMTSPIISFVRSIPAISYLPLLIAILGFSGRVRITAIAIGALFPILLATIDGIRSVGATVDDVTRSYRIGWARRFLFVQLPAATPRIFAGLELSIAAGLVVMVASELLGAEQGIGAQVLLAQQYFRFVDMWAGVVLLAIIGVVVNLIFRFVRSRVLSWYDGIRAAEKNY